MQVGDFKNVIPLEERISEAKNIRHKYPTRVPVIIQSRRGELNLSSCKFLVPSALKVSSLYIIIRRRIALPSKKALFLFNNNRLLPGNGFMSDIDQSDDGFVYIYYDIEDTFG